MGGSLAKVTSEAWAYVQPGAVTGISPGGVVVTAQPGAVTGVEQGGITVNVATGGPIIAAILVSFGLLYFLTLMPSEITYLIILFLSGLVVSNDKYWIIAGTISVCLLSNVLSKTNLFYILEKYIEHSWMVLALLLALIYCVVIIQRQQNEITNLNSKLEEISQKEQESSELVTNLKEEVIKTSEVNNQLKAITAPGDSIMRPDRQLTFDQRLESPKRLFNLVMQTDCNLVIYRYSDGKPIWATGTCHSGSNRAVMQSDGNFVLYDGNGRPHWDSGTCGNDGAHLSLQDDGNLVIYTPSGRPIWASNTVTSA